MMRVYTCLLMFTFGLLGCRTNYIFIQTNHSYINPLHNRENGKCCDNPSQPPLCDTACDNIFTICMTHTSQALPARGNIQREDCPMGFFVSRTFNNSDNITFNTSVPTVFTGDIWPVRYIRPGSFQLLVQVVDDDFGNPDDFVDFLVVNYSLSPPSSTLPTNYTSSAGVFSIVLSFKVECSENLYGDDCTVFCEPCDDAILGHFTCNSDGERVCLEGYQNPANNCTDCRLAEGCLHGYCVEPGDCLCHEGYEGDFCTRGTSDKSRDSRVTYIVVGVLLGGIVVAVLLVLLVLVWNRNTVKQMLFWKKSSIFMPGDNPVYMTSAGVGGDHSSHSPTQSVTSDPVTILHELSLTSEVQAIQHTDDDISSPQPPSTDNIHGVIDPYGNYGDKTITRVAGMATPPPLFDDSKYACSPQLTCSDTDVDSDFQSEYL